MRYQSLVRQNGNIGTVSTLNLKRRLHRQCQGRHR
ncbi:hypothetical protein EVA_13237 [gut metagenome]|uniref:Uncharacterized protein n=1 Tax=gut metagenome TaxID=749906 RepID=J9FUK9_9ZZZZ